MKIIFNDATELQVQSVTNSGDYLRILTIAANPEQLRKIFEDPVKTKKMIVEERGKQTPYSEYTSYHHSEEYPGKIYGVVMYRPEKTPEVQTELVNSSILVAKIQAQSLEDVEALTVKNLYPIWNDIIGQTVKLGYKFVHKDMLYKTIQPALTIQEQYIPGEDTESLYAVIDENHAGTADDPIPYNGNMELEKDKYYSQDETVYKCTRSTGQPIYNALVDLIGIYVELAE